MKNIVLEAGGLVEDALRNVDLARYAEELRGLKDTLTQLVQVSTP